LKRTRKKEIECNSLGKRKEDSFNGFIRQYIETELKAGGHKKLISKLGNF